MPNFGYETAGVVGSTVMLNCIVGSKFSIPKAGVAFSITAYVQYGYGFPNTGGKIKCAIYDSSLNLVANGETEEWEFPAVGSTFDWHTFNFVGNRPILSVGDYWLVAWQNNIAFAVTGLFYDAGDVNQGQYDNNAYNGFPDPLVPDAYENREYSIYCTYISNTELIATQTNEQELFAVQSNE